MGLCDVCYGMIGEGKKMLNIFCCFNVGMPVCFYEQTEGEEGRTELVLGGEGEVAKMLQSWEGDVEALWSVG